MKKLSLPLLFSLSAHAQTSSSTPKNLEIRSVSESGVENDAVTIWPGLFIGVEY